MKKNPVVLWARRVTGILPLGVLAFGLLGFGLSSPAHAQKGADAQALSRALGIDPTEEAPTVTEQHRALAKEIGKDVVCLCGTCPKRTITACDCGWAHLMQTTLVNMVAEGHDHDSVLDNYRKIYGSKGLALPPDDDVVAKGAWALPYFAGAMGLVVLGFIGWRIKQRDDEPEIAAAGAQSAPASAAPGAEEDAQAELARELEELD